MGKDSDWMEECHMAMERVNHGLTGHERVSGPVERKGRLPAPQEWARCDSVYVKLKLRLS